jgi:ATP-dependent RNA helicase RhlE
LSDSSFVDLDVCPEVIDALAKRGIVDPFPIQVLVIGDALAGKDLIASSRTGSGKTLAFAIPIVERTKPDCRRPAALVLVPTRELASQVTQEFEHIAGVKGLRVASVYGGVGLPEQARRAAKAHIIVATPGRLEDLASRNLIKLDQVRTLVLDEADRMLDMGFQPQIQRIVARIPRERQTMFFSATLDGNIGRAAEAYTKDPVRHSIESLLQTVDEATHKFIPVAQSSGKVQALVDLLQANDCSTLVFVRTKRGSARLALKLRSLGIKATEMHGDMTQAARERSLSRFATGKCDTLVATDVAARGIDVDIIDQVVNFDPPEDHKAYIHRVGRTARAGRAGTGITLVGTDEQRDIGRIAQMLKLSVEFEQGGLKTPAPRLAYTSARGRDRRAPSSRNRTRRRAS